MLTKMDDPADFHAPAESSEAIQGFVEAEIDLK